MLLSHPSFIGIDSTAGRKPFTLAALDAEARLLALEPGELEDVLIFLGRQTEAIVVVNAPSAPNRGLVRRMLASQSLNPGRTHGADMRMAEFELRGRGIPVSPTQGRAESCPEWMKLGFILYRKLTAMGFEAYPAENASRQWLETHPYAAFCTILGQPPLPKLSLEGRLQRQLILYELGVRLEDPMGFFEEITRHRLMKGILPLELVYPSEQLDALVAAYTAFIAANKPGELLFVGDREEGRIALPVGELKAKYSRDQATNISNATIT